MDVERYYEDVLALFKEPFDDIHLWGGLRHHFNLVGPGARVCSFE